MVLLRCCCCHPCARSPNKTVVGYSSENKPIQISANECSSWSPYLTLFVRSSWRVVKIWLDSAAALPTPESTVSLEVASPHPQRLWFNRMEARASLVQNQREVGKESGVNMSKPPCSRERPPRCHHKESHLWNTQMGCSPRSLDSVDTSLFWCEHPLRNSTGLQN